MTKPCDAFFGREQESGGDMKLFGKTKEEWNESYQQAELRAMANGFNTMEYSTLENSKKGDIQISTIAKQPPTYTHQGDAGADLYASNSLKLGKGDIISVPTGVRVAIPQGYVGLIQPRSSMSAKGILAATGVIDSGYRGEVKVTLLNLSGASTMIMPGDRVAQLLLIPVARAEFVAVEELPSSERGVNGFGSSGR